MQGVLVFGGFMCYTLACSVFNCGYFITQTWDLQLQCPPTSNNCCLWCHIILFIYLKQHPSCHE